MATKKTQKQAKINWGWDAPENRNGKATRSTKRKTEKNLKLLGVKGIVTVLILIVIFGAIGIGGCFLITRKDCFEIIGQDELSLTIGENYIDEGVKVIEFGRDCSNKVKIETNLVKNLDGSYSAELDNDGNPILKTYYIIYTVNTVKYSKIADIKRIRLISFVEQSEEIPTIEGGSNE